MEQSAEPYLLNECYVQHISSLRSVLNDNGYIYLQQRIIKHNEMS